MGGGALVVRSDGVEEEVESRIGGVATVWDVEIAGMAGGLTKVRREKADSKVRTQQSEHLLTYGQNHQNRLVVHNLNIYLVLGVITILILSPTIEAFSSFLFLTITTFSAQTRLLTCRITDQQ